VNGLDDARDGVALAEAVISARYESSLRERLSRLVTPAIVDEHARNPTGDHSPALAMVLTAMRQAPVAGKRALLVDEAGREWRMITLSGDRDQPHTVADTPAFETEIEGLHAVFLQRLADLGVEIGADP